MTIAWGLSPRNTHHYSLWLEWKNRLVPSKAFVLGHGDWPWWERDLRVVKKALKFTFNKHLECNTLGYMLAMKKWSGIPAYHMLQEGVRGELSAVSWERSPCACTNQVCFSGLVNGVTCYSREKRFHPPPTGPFWKCSFLLWGLFSQRRVLVSRDV